MKKTLANSGILTALGVLSLVVLLLIPLPALLLDIFTALVLIITVLILSSALSSKKSAGFSLLPSCLLILTLLGLLIQTSFVRLILTQGEAFNGLIIRTISSLVIRSNEIANIVVSFLFFVLFTAMIGVLVVKGATRAAEVAARFTLDSLPGKQMSLDAYYEDKIITQEEHKIRKSKLQQGADFMGALDGSTKFIAGNFKASLFITATNIVAGICISYFLNAEPIETAIRIYVPLSLANGLLAQFMILLRCIIVGLYVTKASSNISSGMTAESPAREKAENPEPLTLEIGYGLIPLVDEDHGAKLLTELSMRQRFAEESGTIFPKIRITRNVQLKVFEYCILVNGKEASRNIICQGCKDISTAEDSVTVILTHLFDIIEQHTAELRDG